MARKHLRILYGCDDRFQLTVDTVKVCLPYFDTVRVINSGPSEFYQKLRDALPLSAEIEQLNWFLEIESARRAMAWSVPWDEWFVWLDADHRPSQAFLENLDDRIELAEKNGNDHIRPVCAEHLNGVYYPPSFIPKDWDELMSKGQGMYCPRNIIKKKRGIRVTSNFGAHEEFDNEVRSETYMPFILHHMKSLIQRPQGVALAGYTNPLVHLDISTAEKMATIMSHPDYLALKAFQRKHKVITSNELIRKLRIEKDETFKKEMKEMCRGFSDDYYTFSHLKKMAVEFDLDFESPHFVCGKECCKFGNVQL